ncbi:MAG: hypothetical protein IH950_10675 [Bacteroidetes bacterium]|nr:hypothetical protein [Bacteroidota bacterium]
MIIHQSQCGENSKKAWDLLKTTMPNISIAKSIAFKTDLQDQAGGVAWKPTIRGFMQNDYFLLMKTFPDKSPDVRPGRAFSHVLLISKDDIDSIADIGSLFKFLPDEIDKSISLEPISFNENEASGIKLMPNFQNRFNKAIHGYVRASSFKNTIIWVGEENFEKAVFKFWQILSPKDKENLNFGINFNVDAIPDDHLNFITTPENIENKFMNRGFCVIRRNDTQTLTEISEQILAGDINARQRIERFQDAIESKQLSRANIDKIAIVIKTFEEIDLIVDFKKLNSLSHIIAEYSPDEKKGVALKAKLVDHISKLIQEGDVTEILLTKNFKIKSYRDSENTLTLSVSSWLTKYLFSVTETKKKNFSSLFKNLSESAKSNWWTKLIDNRINKFLAEINSDSVSVVFNWLQSDFDIFKNIQSAIDSSKDSEYYFISQLPSNFDKSNFKALKEFAIRRSWYKFHSKILVLEHPFEKAISEQLEVDTDLSSVEGIEIIINGVTPRAIIDFTVSNGDKRLVVIAGRLCHEDSSLLENIEVSNGNWQEIWFESITNGNKVTEGFKEPHKKIFKLFDTIVDGNSVNENLLDKISETEFANLLNYKKREDFSNILSSTVKTKFLAKTSSALLESLSKDSTVELPTDKTLSDYIANHAIGDFLYYNRSNIKSVIPIFIKFNQLPETSLRDYVYNYTGNIDVVDATQLGKLVYSRSFDSVANGIYNKASIHNNWKVALNECYLLLGGYTQMSIKWSGLIKDVKITEDQWWSALAEIAYKLYSGGPKENKIWIEADGEEYDLLTVGTGKELWIAALNKLRNGGCVGITVKKLLKKMMRDHKRNGELKTLNELRNKI